MSAEEILRVVRGRPSDEELAAVLAVLLAGRTQSAPTRTQPSGWSAYWRTVRAPLVAGPGAWRSSAQPGTSST